MPPRQIQFELILVSSVGKALHLGIFDIITRQGCRTHDVRKDFRATRWSLLASLFSISLARPASLYCQEYIYIYVEIKMPTRCNGGFYCRSYCLLNMFRAPLCPSSGAQEYYTVVAVFRAAKM